MNRRQRIHDHLQSEYGLDESDIADLVTTAIDNVKDIHRQIHEALAKGDLEHVALKGHSLKGVAMNVGLGDMAALGLRIEEEAEASRAAAGPTAGLRALLDRLHEMIREFEET